jgi:HPt (histidine-containing phosphotransfer) domain-containing protein
MVATMVDHELNELRREFLGEARDKVAEMQAALEAGRDAASLERLAYLAHQLKGSGGSYGYQRISEDAAGLEKAIEDGRVDGELGGFVNSLRSEIDRAVAELD